MTLFDSKRNILILYFSLGCEESKQITFEMCVWSELEDRLWFAYTSWVFGVMLL